MRSILAHHSRLGLNQRPLTAADFYRCARRERVKVVEIPLTVRGFYGVARGRRFIALDARMRGQRWLFTAWHEMAHHFLHTASTIASYNFYHYQEEPRVKFEADSFAALALVPLREWREMQARPVEEWRHGLTTEILRARRAVWERYEI